MDASSRGTTLWYDLWDDLWQRSMPSPDAAARHTGAGVARRQAHHERMRDERAREAAAGNAELPPEDDAVEMASAVHVLDCTFDQKRDSCGGAGERVVTHRSTSERPC